MGLAWRGDPQGRRCPNPTRVFMLTLSSTGGVTLVLGKEVGDDSMRVGRLSKNVLWCSPVVLWCVTVHIQPLVR